jgi:hypothetical protein
VRSGHSDLTTGETASELADVMPSQGEMVSTTHWGVSWDDDLDNMGLYVDVDPTRIRSL